METQPEPTLVELIRYNNWANAQIIATCQQLSAEQQAASAAGAYGSIYATLRHIVLAEADYINRMTGQGPKPPFGWRGESTLEELAAFSDVVAGAWLDVVQRVSPNSMVHEEEDGNTMDYKASLLFLQAINHGIEHRTNITTILSGLGLPVPEIDGWGYLFNHPQTFALKETFKQDPNPGNS